MLITLYKIGEQHFRLLGTNGFHVMGKSEKSSSLIGFFLIATFRLICEYELVIKIKIFFKQKTAYEILSGLVGSEMCIRDSIKIELCVKLSLLRLLHVDHVVQNRRTTLSLAWYEWFS